MAKRAQPTIIGAFVVGALGLAALSVVLLSEGGLFEQRPRHVMYFEGSVYGLQVGSPVIFRGVKVGTVTEIALYLNPDDAGFSIPVTARLDPRTVQGPDAAERVSIPDLVEQGLRARLGLQSLITRQLYIEVDFFPERPAVFRAKVPDPAEIPTIPTPFQEMVRRFEDFPVDRLLENISTTAESVTRLVSSEELASVIRGMDDALMELTELARSLREGTGPLAGSVEATLEEAREALAATRATLEASERLLRSADETVRGAGRTLAGADRALETADEALGRIAALSAEDSALVVNLNAALLELSRAARSARDLASEDSELVVNMNETLDELRRSARAVRSLADVLERQPESLLRGRRPGGGSP